MRPATKASILLVLAALFLPGATPYQKPPQAVLDVLNSPLTPILAIGPTRHFAVQGQPVRYPPIKSFHLTRPRGTVSPRRHALPEAAPGGSGRAQLTPHAHLGDRPYTPFRQDGRE